VLEDKDLGIRPERLLRDIGRPSFSAVINARSGRSPRLKKANTPMIGVN